MNKTLEAVIDRIRTWPEERQNDVAQLLDDVERAGTEIFRVSDAERQAIEVGLEQARRGEFVSDADMAAFWNRNKGA